MQKTIKKLSTQEKKYRVRPDEFLKIMKRLELIDQEVKAEEELFDLKIKTLELEKQYLLNLLQPR